MAGMFDDLIQKYAAPVAGAPPSAPAVQSSGGMFDDLVQKYSTGRGDRLPMAAGAVPHAMPASSVQGGPPPSVGGDVAASAGSRVAAGVLDIPGTPGDLTSLADSAGSAAAQGILRLFGVSPETRQKAHAVGDAIGSNPLGALPTSEGVKNAVGFQAYQPQTDTGKTFDKWGGGAVEMLPSLTLTGGAGLVKKGLQEGIGAAVKQGAGDVAKYVVAPSVAGEAAGQATQGTPLEPWARVGAALATGGVAGVRGTKVTGAPSVDKWRVAGKQAYADMKAAGVGVKPGSFDAMVNRTEQELHAAGYRPALHGPVKTVLAEMKASKGVPQSYEELDQMHRLAMGQTKSIDPDTRRVAGMLADRIDGFMQHLQPGDLMAGNPSMAFNALKQGRDAWRRMRTAEQIDNMVAKAKDAAGANYTAAGLQTAIKQQFRGFKWQGKAQLTPAYKALSDQQKKLVDAIIKGGNALRLIGKFNFRNPVVAATMGALGATGSPLVAAGALGIGDLARAISARGTAAKVDQLSGLVRGGKITAGGWGQPPNAIFYGAAAKRSSDKSKKSGQ